MNTAGSGTVGSSGEEIEVSGSDTIKIKNTGSATLTVSITGIHDGDDVDLLAQDEKEYYRNGYGGDRTITLTGDGATYVWSIVAKGNRAD